MEEDEITLKKSQLEDIVEKKVEEKLRSKEEKPKNDSSDQNMDRRSFLKKLGAGAAGLGAFALSPAAADINIRHDGNMNLYESDLDLSKGGENNDVIANRYFQVTVLDDRYIEGGKVTTDKLYDAIDDWRAGTISIEGLRKVINAWQSETTYATGEETIRRQSAPITDNRRVFAAGISWVGYIQMESDIVLQDPDGDSNVIRFADGKIKEEGGDIIAVDGGGNETTLT